MKELVLDDLVFVYGGKGGRKPEKPKPEAPKPEASTPEAPKQDNSTTITGQGELTICPTWMPCITIKIHPKEK